MLRIYFFTWRGEYTGEPVWEGEKEVVGAAPVGGGCTDECHGEERGKVVFLVF